MYTPEKPRFPPYNVTFFKLFITRTDISGIVSLLYAFSFLIPHKTRRAMTRLSRKVSMLIWDVFDGNDTDDIKQNLSRRDACEHYNYKSV